MSKPDPYLPYGPAQTPWASQVPEIAKRADGGTMVSPPSGNAKTVYQDINVGYPFENQKLPPQLLQVPPCGLSESERKSALDKLREYVFTQRDNFLGYQTVERMDYDDLHEFLRVLMNNIGDPFINGYFTTNAKTAERSVLDYYASLWNAIWPSQPRYQDAAGQWQPGDPESYWGYVLTMGSTEGNLYAVLNARDYLSGVMLFEESDGSGTIFKPNPPPGKPNYYTPVAFFSEDTHYSINKAIHAMNVDSFSTLGARLYPDECPIADRWEDVPEVPSVKGTAEYPVGTGVVDIDKLEILVRFFARKGYPILVVLNYGTTFKGSYDDVAAVSARLMPIFEQYGLVGREVQYGPNPGQVDHRDGYWIHVDGALGASYMPFVEMAHAHGRLPAAGPVFDFRLPTVKSIVTSGHKWPGAPAPCGVYMTRQKYLVAPPDTPEYLGAPDTTFAGSRNGLSATVLWNLIARGGYDAMVERAVTSMELADYTMAKLQEVAAQVKSRQGVDIWLQRSPLSLGIIFRKPTSDILFKYSLCTADDPYTDPATGAQVMRTYVHMYIFWDRSKEVIDALAKDLAECAQWADPTPIQKKSVPAASIGRRGIRMPRRRGLS